MDAEQLKFLQGRLRKASVEQPDLKRLKTLLLRLGGEYLVAPPSADYHLSAILESGFVMKGDVTMKRLKTSMCHQNVAAAWTARKYGIVGIATGYALSDDGLWRQHSWGLLRDGILETTEVRVTYFGLLMQGDKADHFAARNSC